MKCDAMDGAERLPICVTSTDGNGGDKELGLKPESCVRQQTIDRGPAWIAAILSCVIIAMHYGILNCGSLYYPSWIDATGYPISMVSWLVTGQFAIAFCLAPLYNRLLEKIPNRVGALLGTLMTSGAIILSTTSNNFFTFMVPYTIFGGVGLGITVIPVLGILSEYFDRYRVLALALAASGSGFGTFLFSKLDAFLIETYTWRMALTAQALLHLNVFPLRLLLRPLAPEPAPAPTLLVPGHPDLTVCDLPLSKTNLTNKQAESGPSNLPVSLFSIASLRSTTSGLKRICGSISAEESHRGTRSNQDIRVVIEYVKMTRLSNLSDTVVPGPIHFLPSPGPGVMEQLESGARDYFSRTDITAHAVLIPIMFVLGEIDSSNTDMVVGSRRTLGFSESSDNVGNQSGMGSSTEMDEMSQMYRRVVVGDTLASHVIAARERCQLKQTVNEVICRGQKSIKQTTAKLIERGLAVCSRTVTVLIDQTDFFASADIATNFGSDDRVCVLGYHGPEDAPIPEEVEPDDGGLEKHEIPILSENKAKDPSRKLEEQKPFTQSTQLLDRSSQAYLNTTSSKSRGGFILGSMGQLTKIDKYGGSCYRSHDVFASVISVSSPQKAADLLMSKLHNEAKKEIVPSTVTYRELPKMLLGDLLLTCFLFSRSFAFITDSVMYAHLSNFGLELGFGEERSASLLSFVGVTAMLGRLGMGFVGQFFERMDIQGTSAGCLVFVSVFVALVPVFYSFNAMTACCIIYGLLISPSFAFAPGITYQIVGPQRYDEAVSYLFQFEALGFLVGGPVGGYIKEIRGRYLDCFIFSAISEFLSGLILTVQTLICSKWWRRMSQRCLQHRSADLEATEMEMETVDESFRRTTSYCGSSVSVPENV